MNQEIIIVGIGEIAEIAADYFYNDSEYKVSAFVAEEKYMQQHAILKQINGCPVVPLEKISVLYPSTRYKAFIALGYDKLNHGRARLYSTIKRMGYDLVSYISSFAYIGRDVHIGDNCFILEHNVLQKNVIIGNDVTLWSGNHIGHRSVIEDHVFLSSHVAVSGYCRIGQYSFCGINSAFGDHVSVGENCFIGGGVTILKDTYDGEIYRSATISPEKLSSKNVFGF